MTKLRHTAPDWPTMISDLEGKGHTCHAICAAMGFGTSESIVRHYKLRGVQPMYYRGEALIAFWCQELGKQLSEVPRAQFRKPYRIPSSVRAKQKTAEAEASATLALQTFISAIPVANANGSQVKRKPGRPKKQQVTA